MTKAALLKKAKFSFSQFGFLVKMFLQVSSCSWLFFTTSGNNTKTNIWLHISVIYAFLSVDTNAQHFGIGIGMPTAFHTTQHNASCQRAIKTHVIIQHPSFNGIYTQGMFTNVTTRVRC